MKTRKENTREKANSPAYGIISFTSKSEARAYLETSFKKGTTEDALQNMVIRDGCIFWDYAIMSDMETMRIRTRL